MKNKAHTLLKNIIVIELVLIAIGLLFIQFHKLSDKPASSVLIIDIHGEIVDSAHSNSYHKDTSGKNAVSVSAEELIGILQHYENDDNIKAFILDIDSNGGSSAGSDNLIKQIRQMKKPVIAVVRDQALSAGYYIASATERIFANELSNIGDIGHTSIIGYTKDDLNYKECYVSSSEFKRMYYDDCEGFERTQIYKEKKNHLIKATDIMAREIATFRNLPEDHVLKLADGTIFSGVGALRLGLIDEVGGLHEAVDWLEGELGMELDIVYYREMMHE